MSNQTITAQILSHREFYEAKLGWRVFPVIGKEPVASGWQTRTFSDEEWSRATGLAVVCGPGWFVLDIDSHISGCPNKTDKLFTDHSCGCELAENIYNRLKPHLKQTGIVTRSPTHGFHVYLLNPDESIKCSAGVIHPQIDTKAQGKGYVLVPPSVHPFGGTYEWDLPPGVNPEPYEPIPDVLLKAISQASTALKDHRAVFKNGGQIGSRHACAASLAGYMWHLLSPRDPADVTDEHLGFVQAVLRNWDTRNAAPLGAAECDRIAKTIGKTHYDGLVSRTN